MAFQNTTAAALISRSISHTEIAHADYDPDLATALEAESDDSVTGNDEQEFWGTDADGNEWRVHLTLRTTANEADPPDFDDVSAGLDAGIYSAENLNPPSGADCTHLLVRDDGSLGWCDTCGNDCTSFSVSELCNAVQS